MGLISYVVNWDELGDMLDGLSESLTTRGISDVSGIQKVKGFAESIPAMQAEYRAVSWELPYNIVITGVTVNQSSWKGEDYWELWVDDERLFETVYTKELGEQKHWEVVHPVSQGQVIEVILHNNSGNSRDIWSDIEYLKIGEFEEVPDEPVEPEPEPEPVEPEPEPEPVEPEPEPEPEPDDKVHFCGIHIGRIDYDADWEEDNPQFNQEWGYQGANYMETSSSEVEAPDIPALYRNHSELLTVGEYPNARASTPNAYRTTLDSIAVPKGYRLRYFEKRNFEGEIILDVVGDIIVYNSVWGYRDYYLNDTFLKPEDQTQFPPHKRIITDENDDMREWNGSFIITRV